MTGTDSQQFVRELAANIQARDLIKARIVLSHMPEMERPTQRRALIELSGAEDRFAIPLLADLVASDPDLATSFPTLQETLYAKVLDSPEVLVDLLRTGQGLGATVYLAEIAGEIRLAAAVPVLIAILTREKGVAHLKAAISALGLIGDSQATSAVAEYLYAEDPELIAAAVMALGQIGSPTAVTRLAERLGAVPALDTKIIETLGQIQTPEALARLNETLGSHHARIRNAGKKVLAEMGVKALPILVGNLRLHDPDLIIHTLDIVGEIGDEGAIGPVRDLLHYKPFEANIRFAAYEALGKLPLQKRAYALAAGLQDPVENVRAAAANAIDRNFSLVLGAGIKNMIKLQDTDSRNIILTIVDAQCGRIFMALIEDDYFRETAFDYLSIKAHPEIRGFFVRCLRENGRPDLAERIAAPSRPEEQARSLVYAVDDSKMILKIYRSMLHNLGCEPVLFESAIQALEQVRIRKPDLVLTDLNMPVMNGIDLTLALRKLYSRSELPVIMVTTQNESQDTEAAVEAGVDTVINKPFTEERIGQVLVEYGPRR